MLGQSQAKQITDRVLALSKNGQTEVVLWVTDGALTRFANNIIHQNVAETNTSVTVRVALGQRVGVAGTNAVTDDGLPHVVERAMELARSQPENPDFAGFAEPKAFTPACGFDEAAAAVTPEARARAVGEICRQSKEASTLAAGAFSTDVQEVAIANSHGLFCYHPATLCDLHSAVTAEGGGNGYSQVSSWKLADMVAEPVGREAVQKALRARHPQPLEPGVFTVILEPYAAQDLLNMLNHVGFGARAMQEGRSWMNDRIGQQVLSPSVTIADDGGDELGFPLPFDFEGVPKHKVVLVENGVPRGPVYDLTTARKEGKESTGHALPPPNTNGPLATHLVMSPGTKTVEEMIRATERGLYITRFWYTRVVHPRDCVITGMTRDGTFLIEHGELTRPVKNLRFTQGYVPALAQVEMIGHEARTLTGGWLGASRVPALKLKQFNFTGATQ
jgi:predicted Zn-dependent protease